MTEVERQAIGFLLHEACERNKRLLEAAAQAYAEGDHEAGDTATAAAREGFLRVDAILDKLEGNQPNA